MRLENFIGIISVTAIMSFAENSHAQNSVKSYSDTLYAQILDYDVNAITIIENPDNITWLQIDSFTVQQFNSAIRGHGPSLDTLTISFYLENGWDSIRIERTKKRNTELITELSKIYRNYMDSIEWKGFKITESSFESDIVMHLKMKYPVQFTQEQKQMIDQIIRCPNFIHQGIGVFLNCTNPSIKEDDIRRSYLAKLEYISKIMFGQTKVDYGKRIYQ